MKNLVKSLSVVAIFLSVNVMAQETNPVQSIDHKAGFVDVNGDGFNDNAPDTDGGGIPNGQDLDYTGPKTRTGGNSNGFVDADGDGINDNAVDSDGDGIPNGQDADYVRPMDGSGAGNGQNMRRGQRTGIGTGTGIGVCDETGPKGKRGQGKK